MIMNNKLLIIKACAIFYYCKTKYNEEIDICLHIKWINNKKILCYKIISIHVTVHLHVTKTAKANGAFNYTL